MKQMTKLFLLLTAIMLPTTMLAYTFEIGGIYYIGVENDVTGNKAYVTYRDTNYRSYTGHVTIPDVVVYMEEGYRVVGITDSAFYGSDVESVSLPRTLEMIGKNAFASCLELKSINIPEKVNSIGESAFRYCRSITKIEIPDLVKEIKYGTFLGCSALKDITIGKSVAKINYEAFYSVDYYDGFPHPNPRSLTWNAINCDDPLIHDLESMTWNSNLETLTIGDGVQTLPFDFVPLSKIQEIRIPNSVTTIGDRAFRECADLKRVDFGDSVVTIGEGAFNSCTSLSGVTLPNTVKTIGSGAFYGCKSLSCVNMPNTVNTIGSGAFGGCTALTSIEIPSSVSLIDEGTFSGCTNLSHIRLNYGITEIKRYAFRECSSLTEIELPNSLQYLYPYAFSESGLKSIKLPDSLLGLNYSTFDNCSQLTSVIIGKSLKGVGYDYSQWGEIYDFDFDPFKGCSNLMSIVVDPANTSFDSRGNCNAIIETATNRLMFGCNGSYIPNGVQTIGPFAFANCNGIVKLDMPESVNNILPYAFNNCINLKILNFNAINCTEIGSYLDGRYWEVFDTNFSFQTVSFGDKVERIPANFPKFNMSTRNLVLPNSIKTIEAGAFNGTAKAVVIGDNIESIAARAFKSGITTVYVNCDTPRPCSAGAFANPQTLYVPAGTKMKYFMADGWCEFANIEVKDFEDNYVNADTIILDTNNITLQKTSTCQLRATILPNNATTQNVTWISINPMVATVSSTGLVKGIANGVTDIVAYVDNVATKCRVNVSNLMVEELKLSASSLQLELDDMVTLNAIITPDNAENKTLEWEIPENNVIMTQIYNNTHSLNIGAIGEGMVTITARTTDGSNKSASCIVKVGKQELPGDVNGDSELSIADINMMIDLVINDGYQTNYDLNSDGELTIADINYLIDLILNK